MACQGWREGLRLHCISSLGLGIPQQAVDNAQNGILVFLVQMLDLNNPVEGN